MHASDKPLPIVLGLPRDATARYSRQAVVPGFGTAGQLRLMEGRVAVVGLGGLGCPVLQYLSMAGVRRIGIVDYDAVELHNIQRQSLYGESSVGRLKTDCAAERVRELSSCVDITRHSVQIKQENVDEVLSDYDLILDCTDSLEARCVLSDHCRLHGKTHIFAAVLGWEGQVCVALPSRRCFRCIFRGTKRSADGCDQRGVIGPMCGVIGSLQAVEAIKVLSGTNSCSSSSESRIIALNGLTQTQDSFTVAGDCRCTGLGELPGGCLQSSQCSAVPEVTWDEVCGDQTGKYLVIDIRSKEHYEMARAPDSLWIENVEEWLSDANISALGRRMIAVVCYRGNSAAEVVKLLRSRGLEGYRVAGGIQALLERGGF